MNWAMVAAAAAAVPLFLPFQLERKRLEVDSPTSYSTSAQEHPSSFAHNAHN